MSHKILVVDDEAHIVLMVSGRLRANGYEIITANSGKECLEKAREHAPDLILLDVMMPVMDGYQCLESLKKDPATASIRVLMLSAMVQEADMEKASQLGAQGYIHKPFDANDLLQKIQRELS